MLCIPANPSSPQPTPINLAPRLRALIIDVIPLSPTGSNPVLFYNKISYGIQRDPLVRSCLTESPRNLFPLVIVKLPSVGRRRLRNYAQHLLDARPRLQYCPRSTHLRLHPPRIDRQGYEIRSCLCLLVRLSTKPSVRHADDAISTTHQHVQRRLADAITRGPGTTIPSNARQRTCQVDYHLAITPLDRRQEVPRDQCRTHHICHDRRCQIFRLQRKCSIWHEILTRKRKDVSVPRPRIKRTRLPRQRC